MNNKYKSLSDSSTSESEDDGRSNIPVVPTLHRMSFPRNHARPARLSASENEDEYGGKLNMAHVDSGESESHVKSSSASESDDDGGRIVEMTPMFSPVKGNYFKRKTSTDASEEENGGIIKRTKYEMFKSPTELHDTDASGSESDDRASMERSIPLTEIATSNSKETSGQPLINSVGHIMMEKMGYKLGTGLGKHSQGRTQIIEASKQRGRRGLGLHLTHFESDETLTWDFGQENELIKEDVTWMPECYIDTPDISTMRDWMKQGVKLKTLENEHEFCDPTILKNVLDYKAIFDKLAGEEMRKARTRANPFETIRGVIFLNRAAMKMANMDSVFDFMFTDPKDEHGVSTVGPNDLLYFADVCAGPGGFSEYVLWRKKWECKGFGFTLKGENDFKLGDFFSGPPETFEPYYGENDDGNIYVPQNLRAFRKFVLEHTENKGVHFMMADGGFSVEGDENMQEVHSKRLYLCQFLCALMIVRCGGHFVCKLFDIFTPFSVGLIYLMYHCFRQICIFKPNTSRPANSERYIICKWRNENVRDICDYMFEVNGALDQLHKVTSVKDDEDIPDIVEVVPLEVLKGDEDFFKYIVNSNNVIGERQVIHLDKIKVFAINVNLHDDRQSDFRKQCLEAWNIPDKARAAPACPDPRAKFYELTKGQNTLSNSTPEHLVAKNLSSLNDIYNYKFVICGEGNPTFFLALGRTNIYHLNTKLSKWQKTEINLELPADTLFYGELIQELKGEGKGQKKTTCLHLIDALFLGGKDVKNLHYEDRMTLARKLAKAVFKGAKTGYSPLKVKRVWSLDEITTVLQKLQYKILKSSSSPRRLCFDLEDGHHFIPSGILIFKTVGETWVVAYSKSHQRQYYFNCKTKKSVFERLPENALDFVSCFGKRIFWSWTKDVQLLDNQCKGSESQVHGPTLCSFVRQRFQAITGKVPKF